MLIVTGARKLYSGTLLLSGLEIGVPLFAVIQMLTQTTGCLS